MFEILGQRIMSCLKDNNHGRLYFTGKVIENEILIHM